MPYKLMSGTADADVLRGDQFGVEDDEIHGLAGDDVITGLDGDDWLFGGEGDDSIDGGAGDDLLNGGEGNDLIVGGAGSDRLNGGEGNDVLRGGASADEFSGEGGDDWIEADAEDRGFDGGEGIDTVSFATAATGVTIGALATVEIIIGSAYDDVLRGGPAGEMLRGGEGNDTLDGGLGNAALFGDAGDDMIVLRDGASAVNGGLGIDTIRFDYWARAEGGVVVDLAGLWGGGSGEVNGASITGVERIATLSGSRFDDVIITGDLDTAALTGYRGSGLQLLEGDDSATGGSFDDLIYGGEGDDSLSGGAGDDVLEGGLGSDVLNGGDGDDSIRHDGSDIVDGGAGRDSVTIDLQYGAGPATIDLTAVWSGGVGTVGTGTVRNIDAIDSLILTAFDDIVRMGDLSGDSSYVSLREGNDRATGGMQEDRFEGGSGDDRLEGAGGNDTLTGGTGRDVLDGGDGDDQLFADALDSIVGGAGHDALAILGNAQALRIDLSRVASHGLVTINGTAATGIEEILYLIGSSQDDVVVAGNYATSGIGYFLSAGLDLRDGNDEAIGGAADDLVFGGSGNDRLSGGGGIDALYGGAGVDRLDGGVGNDTLDGGAGDDWLEGGLGNDVLVGGAGSDTVNYAWVRSGITVNLLLASAQDILDAGRDRLEDIENIVGTAYGDVLTGNAANNHLSGGPGNDQLTGGDGADRLDGGLGVDSVSYARAISAITVDLKTGYSSGGTGGDTLISIETLVATRYNDLIAGSGAAEILDGGGGIDTISYAPAAARVKVDLAIAVAQNTIGAGVDTLSGFENILGSAFHDTLTGTVDVNRLEGGSGNDVLAGRDGSDTLIGGDGDDTLIGGAGNDRLEGGAGIDIVSYADAISAVTIDHLVQATGGGGSDTLIDIEGVIGSAFDDQLKNIYGDSRLYGGAGDDYILTRSGDNLIDGGFGIDTLAFGNLGEALTITLLVGSAQDTGGGGIDTIRGIENLTGGYGNDVLSGDGYGNVLTGNLGNDVLTGNLGNDVLIGGFGVDTASYAAAAGAVRVSLLLTDAQSTLSAGTDTLSGIENLTGSAHDDQLTGDAADNVLIGNAGNDLLVGGLGNDLLTGGAGIDTASYATVGAGVTISLLVTAAQDTISAGVDTLSSIENLVGSAMDDVLTGNAQNNAISGGVGNDLIDGGTGADTLDGGNGNDVLRGGAGDDILTGGAGRDTLTGGAGNDRFVYVSTIQSPASANADRITDFAAGDVLDLSAIDANGAGAGDGVFAIVSAFTGTAGELVLAFDAATATTTLRGDTDGNGIADFSVLFTGDVLALTADWLL